MSPSSNKVHIRRPIFNGFFFLYMFLLIAHIGLVWVLSYFPTQDGPSHIYNLVILHDLINGGKEWGDFFAYQLNAVPNLGFNLLAYPMLNLFSPLVVEKLFLSIYILLMGASLPFFLHTFKRSVLPLSFFVFPVIFNFTLLMGFYSYAVAMPLFLIAFSLSWKIRNHSLVLKFMSFNLLGFIIFYFHLVPFCFFLLSLITITITQSFQYKGKFINLLQLLVIISPSIFNLFLYLTQETKDSLPDFSYLLSISHYIYLIIEFFLFSTVSFTKLQMLLASPFIFLTVLFIYLSLKDFYQKRSQLENIGSPEKTIISLISILILVYLLAPFRFGEGCFFNQRFPWVILLTILPIIQIPETIFWKRFGSTVIAGVVTVFFVFNAIVLWQQSSKVEKFLAGLDVELTKGAFIMTYKDRKPDCSPVDVLLHAVSYYGIFKRCVDIGNYETSSSHFPIHFKNTVPPFPDHERIAYKPATINLAEYPSIQYIVGWEIDSNDREKLSGFFHIIKEKEALSLWQSSSIDF